MKISVESVQMIFKACNVEHLLRSNTQKCSHLKAQFIKAYIKKLAYIRKFSKFS